MTDLADGKMIAEKNPNDLGGKILAKPYTLKREDVAVRYQQLLANIKTSDPVLTEFFIDQQKEENLNVVLDLMPYREEFQLLFNNYTETDFKFVDHSSKGKDREFADQLDRAYQNNSQKCRFPFIFEVIIIMDKMKDSGIFKNIDLIAVPRMVIEHPKKGNSYLLFSFNGKEELEASAISISDFFATISHYWFITKLNQKDIETDENNTTGHTAVIEPATENPHTTEFEKL